MFRDCTYSRSSSTCGWLQTSPPPGKLRFHPSLVFLSFTLGLCPSICSRLFSFSSFLLHFIWFQWICDFLYFFGNFRELFSSLLNCLWRKWVRLRINYLLVFNACVFLYLCDEIFRVEVVMFILHFCGFVTIRRNCVHVVFEKMPKSHCWILYLFCQSFLPSLTKSVSEFGCEINCYRFSL